jgi:hypothetical protein
MDAGGSIALISTRPTRIPQPPVALSSSPRSLSLISSREVSVPSRLIPPTTFAQRRDRDLLDTDDVVRDLVDRGLGVEHLVVDDRVDVHRQVVLGDHRLRRERDHLLAQVDPVADAVDERHEERQPGVRVRW